MKKTIILLTIIALSLCTACSNSEKSENTASVTVDWNTNKVYQWQDYSQDEKFPVGEDFEIQLRLADFPDTVFIWRELSISSQKNGEERVLVNGMPIMNAFFTDLNSDGFPELCSSVYFGSGICDEHLVVYDYHNEMTYTLWDRMKFNYSLYLENDDLYVRELPYLKGENTEENIGKLLIENNELVIKQ